MPIYFSNTGDLDILALSTMGVNVKTTETPFGFFGTGLKYAIATLLRTGHMITLYTGGVKYDLGVSLEIIRGKEFQLITLNGQKLGFTTDLGKTWEIWQAYRELRCNAQDERDGKVSDNFADTKITNLLAPNQTLFIVDGRAIEVVHSNRGNYFIETDPIVVLPHLDIHPRTTRTGSIGLRGGIYYQGVLVYIPKEVTLAFNYNIKTKTELTEDRTIKHTWSLPYFFGEAMANLTDERVLEEILIAPPLSFERLIKFTSLNPVQYEFISKRKNDSNLNPSAYEVWYKRTDPSDVHEKATLEAWEEKLLDEAVDICKIINVHYTAEFTVVNTLGNSTLGLYYEDTGRIYISRAAIEAGPIMLAGTLYEEWCHKQLSYEDCSRPFQNHLLNKLVTFANRLKHSGK